MSQKKPTRINAKHANTNNALNPLLSLFPAKMLPAALAEAFVSDGEATPLELTAPSVVVERLNVVNCTRPVPFK